MKLLTIENARKTLKKGNTYKLAYNNNSFLYMHESINIHQEPLGQEILLIGKTKFLHEQEFNKKNKDLLLATTGEDIPIFNFWEDEFTGKPLFILDDCESYEDIQDVDFNNIF